MTPKQSSLIAKLEQATEGSRDLDFSIAEQIGERSDMLAALRAFQARNGRLPYDDISTGWLPLYTTSLDAALTLVPEGLAWQVGCEIDFTPFALVFGDNLHVHEWAATPGIALCLAAVKARQP